MNALARTPAQFHCGRGFVSQKNCPAPPYCAEPPVEFPGSAAARESLSRAAPSVKYRDPGIGGRIAKPFWAKDRYQAHSLLPPAGGRKQGWNIASCCALRQRLARQFWLHIGKGSVRRRSAAPVRFGIERAECPAHFPGFSYERIP
ncbi:hypothetical protein D3C74_360940 [compost metagenome]